MIGDGLSTRYFLSDGIRWTDAYRARDLVLRFMAAMEAGNPDASVAG